MGLRDFCHSLTLLPPGASVFHKHMSSFKICIQSIIVSKTIVIEGGSGVLCQKILSNFHTNGAILSKTNGYMCLDIVP